MSTVTARDIMVTDVVTVNENSKLTEVADLLINYNISGMPVLDDDGKLVGVISEADLMDQKKRQWAIPRMALFGLFKVPDRLLNDAYQEGCSLQAKDVMTKKVLSADPDTSADEVAELMLRKRINRVPIVDNGRLVGIVTRTDILRGQCGLGCGSCEVKDTAE